MFKGLKSIFVGLLAGTALGILFSPKKGKEFRNDLKKEIDKGGTGLSAIKDTFVKMSKDIGGSCKNCYGELNKTEGFKEGKKRVKEFIDKEVAQDTKEKIKAGYRKAKSSAKKIIKEIKKP